jgi:hypothetical protein
MTLPQSPFDQVIQLAGQGGIEKTLEFLEHRFRSEQEYFKLFEVLKMRCRHRLGLPLIYRQQPDDLAESQQRELEDGLLAACQEVGSLLVIAGQIQEGWMYLQPLTDRKFVKKLIQSIEPSAENVDTIIEIAVSQGAAPAYGYGLLLQHYGTCNAITTFDTQAGRFENSTQQDMAEQLLRHLHKELCDNLCQTVEQEGKTVTDSASLAAILNEHPWLVEGGAFHLDTTHLASVMRIARCVVHQDDLKKAAELAEYGIRLPEDLQYPGAAPFEETYPDHQIYYRGLLGESVEATIKHLEQKCETVDAQQFGPVAYETLVDFLVRVGLNRKAIEVLTSKVIGQYEPLGIAPQVFEIVTTKDELSIVQDFYRDQHDLLGFAIGVLKEGEI